MPCRAHRVEQRAASRRRWRASTARAAARDSPTSDLGREVQHRRRSRPRRAPAPRSCSDGLDEAAPRRAPRRRGRSTGRRARSPRGRRPAGAAVHYAADVAGSTGDEYAHGGHPRWAAGQEVGRRGDRTRRGAGAARPTSRDATRPTSPARSASTARSSWPATRSPSRRCRPSSSALAAAAGETNRYPDNGAVVLTRALADRYGVDPAQIATGCGAVDDLPGTGAGRSTTPARASPSPGARSRCTRCSPRSPAPGRSRCRWSPAAPVARPTPTTSTGCWPRDRRHDPAGLRLQPEQPHRDGGAPGRAGDVPRRRARRRPSSSSTRRTASSSPTPTSPTGSRSCAAARTSPCCAPSRRRGGWPGSASAT